MTPTYRPSRRAVLKGTLATGAAAAAGPLLWSGRALADTTLGSGTGPEQINLTYANGAGNTPANSITVTWAQPNPTATGSVTVVPNGISGGLASPLAVTVTATTRGYTDGVNGQHISTYTATLAGLVPATTYLYAVTDGAGSTFTSTFTTAPSGRVPLRFSSYGDLATPLPLAAGIVDPSGHSYSAWGEASDNAFAAVAAVESLNPVFHLLNGDLCYADKNPAQMPEVWRDFGFNVQRSATNRAWMPCLGNHENEIVHGYASYLARWTLPDNGQGFPGQFYWFQVGSVLVISLDANDVVYQDNAPYWGGGTSPLLPSGSGSATVPTASGFNRYYSGNPTAHPTDPNLKAPGGNLQTVWLQNVLAAARPGLVPAAPTSPIGAIPGIDPSTIDWIVVQMHQIPMSSAPNTNGSDKGLRELWLPLFDTYQVDLVVSGHDHDYERTLPVRGYTPGQGRPVTGSGTVETLQPTPVAAATTTVGVVPHVDSTKGTTYLVVGTGGTNAPTASVAGGTTINGLANAGTVWTATAHKTGTGAGSKPTPDSCEVAVWSAARDPGLASEYGIAVFDVDPGSVPGGPTTLTVTYLHAPTEASKTATDVATVPYTQADQVVLTRPRSDSLSAALPEFATPAAVAAGALAIGGAAVLAQRRRAANALEG